MYGDATFLPVVLGTNLTTYAIARSLHEAYGVRTLVLGRAALRETMHSSILDVRTYADFDSPERIVARLLDVAAEFPDRKRLLIANIEFYTGVVLDHRAELAEHFLIPLPDPAVAQRLMSKSDFARTCAELGVPHPESVLAPAARVVEERLGDTLAFPYPVIVKPADTDVYGQLRFAGKQKIYLVPDAESLHATAAVIAAAGYEGDLVLQAHLAGDETAMRVVNTYSDRHGRVRFASAAQVALAARNPLLVGNNDALLTVHDPALIATVRRLLDAVGYAGAANVDAMLDARTGEWKLLEVNLRQGATSFYTMAAGGNMARCYVEDLVHERELDLEVTTAERLWVNLPSAVVPFLVAPALRGEVLRALRSGRTHTLRYAPDRSLRRRAAVARTDLRHTIDYLKHPRR